MNRPPGAGGFWGLGWVSFLVSLLGPVLANVRFLFPNVVYEGESVLKLDSK